MNPYESDRLLWEYLLFHYGKAEEILPYPFGPHDALDFPVRSVSECLLRDLLPPGPRALDLGCAVGRSTFELARLCPAVIGIDFSSRFIESANTLKRDGRLPYRRALEGELFADAVAEVPAGIDRGRVAFERGDAACLRDDLGSFDVVHMANLIDRLPDPARCLRSLPKLLRPGGQVILTSPCTWLEEFTPRGNWLGGISHGNHAITTLDGLHRVMKDSFELHDTRDLPFLIREHARKFQWSVAQATIWIRRED